jgi:hypothetical protein
MVTGQKVLDSTRCLTTPEVAQALGVVYMPSSLVSLDETALRAVVHQLCERSAFAPYRRYTWDNPLFWFPEGLPAERSQYFSVGNAINFRFWRLCQGHVVPAQGTIEGVTFTGALYMWRCLRRCLDSGLFPLLEASFLASVSEDQFATIFEDDFGHNPLATALVERLANWHDLGRELEHRWKGKFYNVVTESNGSLVAFVALSRVFRAFDDPLFKLTMVNTILHLGSGVARFDAEPLPGIDYHLVKQLLRQGVLIPGQSLRKKLEGQILLTQEESYELRRMALCAFAELSARTGLSGEILDNRWWGNRVHCRTEGPVCLSPETADQCPFLGACAQLTDLRMPLEETRYY